MKDPIKITTEHHDFGTGEHYFILVFESGKTKRVEAKNYKVEVIDNKEYLA